MRPSKLLALAAGAALFASVAHAHPGHDGHDFTWSFTRGVLHPLTGIDHLLAMLAVGIWSAMHGGRARWILPSAFLTTMIAAAVVAPAGATFSGLDQTIVASAFALALLIAFRVRFPLAISTAILAAFAAFHGWAHGAEIPTGAPVINYIAGLALSTAAILVTGLALYSGFGYIARLVTRRAAA